jgi:hypothetical protein
MRILLRWSRMIACAWLMLVSAQVDVAPAPTQPPPLKAGDEVRIDAPSDAPTAAPTNEPRREDSPTFRALVPSGSVTNLGVVVRALEPPLDVSDEETADTCGLHQRLLVQPPAGSARVALATVVCVVGQNGLQPGPVVLRFVDEVVAPPTPTPTPTPTPKTPTPTQTATPTPGPTPPAPATTTPTTTPTNTTAPPTTTPPAPTTNAIRICKPQEVAVVDARTGLPNCRAPFDERVPFLKGELTTLGGTVLVNQRPSVGVGLGAAVLDRVLYAVVRPDVNLHFGAFRLGLGTPLRFEIANLERFSLTDPNAVFSSVGRFRLEDWDQVEDFVRPLRYVSFGRKEDNLYVDVNRVSAITLGHGQLVRRYAPNADIDEDRLFGQLNAYNDVGGIELMAGPLPFVQLVGALAFVKPFGVVRALGEAAKGASDDGKHTDDVPDALDVLTRSISVGATYVADLNAINQLSFQQSPADGRTQLLANGAGQLTHPALDKPFGTVLHGVGVDAEAKVLQVGGVDVKMYADYSHLIAAPSADDSLRNGLSGGGATLGALLRLNIGSTFVRALVDEDKDVQAGVKPRERQAAHALRLRVEGKAFAPTYLPSYFNTLYEVDRLQVGVLPSQRRAALPTKLAAMAAREGEPWRVGGYVEASYLWANVLGVTAVVEDAVATAATTTPTLARNFALHAETHGLSFLQVFATYHHRNFDDWTKTFQFQSDNEVFYLGGRLQVLPFAFINLGVQRAFRVGYTPDDGRRANADGLRPTSIGLQNVWSGGADVELGWQF